MSAVSVSLLMLAYKRYNFRTAELYVRIPEATINNTKLFIWRPNLLGSWNVYFTIIALFMFAEKGPENHQYNHQLDKWPASIAYKIQP